MKKLFSVCLVVALVQSASAITLILDDTNNHTVTVGSGTISQPGFTNGGGGAIQFNGLTAAFGTPDIVDFTNGAFTSVGGNGGQGPQNIVNQALTLLDDTTGDLFSAEVTFFRAPNGQQVEVGIAPLIDNNAGLVINVSPVPEPTVGLLVGISSLAFLRRRRN